jgi:F-type H+-transporting ATPase subunit delta
VARAATEALHDERGDALVEELARVYSEALFGAAKEQGKIDLIRDQLATLADAIDRQRELHVFFFSPLFSTREKKEGLERLLVGADENFINFLKVLIDNHRMPVIFHIRKQYEELWREEHRLLPVEITSAVELDDQIARQIQERVEQQTGRRVELTRTVDENILGGLVVRVSNMILDASIRNQLERLRRQVAKAA